jgi:hypothetical protein
VRGAWVLAEHGAFVPSTPPAPVTPTSMDQQHWVALCAPVMPQVLHVVVGEVDRFDCISSAWAAHPDTPTSTLWLSTGV